MQNIIVECGGADRILDAMKTHADSRELQKEALSALATLVLENVNWVVNKKLGISNLNFKFPRARNSEIIRYYRQTLQASFSAVSKPNLQVNSKQ